MKVPDVVGPPPRIPYMTIPHPTSDIHENVQAAWDLGQYTKGEANRLLKEALAEYLDVEHIILTSSGTLAITIGLMAAKRRDYIHGKNTLVSAYTWDSVPYAIEMAGQVPIFGEIEIEKWQLDYDKESIFGSPDAVCLTDTFGARATDKPDEPFFHDSCHALGLRKIGDRGLFEAFSLAATKMVTAGEGGFISTTYADIAEEAEKVARYVGRLPEASCILALNRLEAIEDEIYRRREHVNRYMEKLGSHAKYQSTLSGHVYSIFGVRLSPEHLENLTRPRDFAVRQYYNPPLHDCTNAREIAESVVALPMAGTKHCDHIVRTILGEEKA